MLSAKSDHHKNSHHSHGLKSDKLKVLQINLHHSKAASNVFEKTSRSERIEIGLITEPYYFKGKVRNLPGGNLIYHNKYTERPRACIFVQKHLNFFVLNEYCTSDIVAIKLQTKINGFSTDLVFCSAYMDGNSEVPEALRKLTVFCKNQNMNLIIGTDSNAHHTIWGDKQTNRRGEMVLDFIIEANLEIVNRGNHPTFVRQNSGTVIDLTLAKGDILQYITNWRVSNTESMSDHRHIRFDILQEKSEDETYRIPESTNWNDYLSELKDNLHNVRKTVMNTKDLEKLGFELKQAVVEAYHSACPLRTKKSNKQTPWWNKKLEEMKSVSRELFNKALKHRIDKPELWNEYRVHLQAYKKEIQNSKKEKWEKFCNDLEDISEGARIHKILSKEHKNKIGSLRTQDGSHTNNEKETLKILNSTHFPESQVNSYDQNHLKVSVRENSSANWELSLRLFSDDKVKWAVNTFKPFKSPGVDGIFPALLQKGIDVLLPYLQTLFVYSHCWGHIVETWRDVKVVYIPKAGKRPSDEAKSYRPISLTSFLLKTMERVIDRYIRDEILVYNPVSINQFAYQEGTSTITALQTFVKRIRKIFKDHEIGIATSVDIQGAFDNTSYDKIKEAMILKNVDKQTCDWIYNMLQSRQIISSLGKEEMKSTPVKGCPQGGVLSPILWCLVIDSLLVKLQNEGYIKVQAFADDIIIMVIGISGRTVSELLQNGLNIVSKWCETQGLKVSAEKTVAVKFTKNEKEACKAKILKLGNTNIQYSNHMKYLGITLDSKLTFKPHLENKLKQANNALWTCKSFVQKNWGISPKMMMWMYTAIVRPMLTYGSFIWYKETEKTSFRIKLNKIQRLACLLTTGAIRTTPTAALEVLLNLPPLHIFMKMEAKITNYKLSTNENRFLRKLTDEHLDKEQQDDPVLNLKNSDFMKPKYNFDLPFKVEIPTRQEWERKEISNDSLNFYTDGSKTENGTGFGVLGIIEISKRMNNLATVFQAEAKAITTCATEIMKWNIKNRKIRIFSDSQAVLKSLINNKTTSKTIQECITTLKKASQHNQIELIWIPGHEGFEGNEKADKLARMGTAKGLDTDIINCDIALNVVKTKIKEWVIKQGNKNWKKPIGARHSKEILKNYSEQLSRQILNLQRTEIQNVIAFLTGHGNFKKHLHTMKVVTSPTCKFCENEETAEHIMCECDAFVPLRLQTFGTAFCQLTDYANISFNKFRKFCKLARARMWTPLRDE